MAWTYDETDLVTTSASGRVNVVRLLIGDTDTLSSSELFSSLLSSLGFT